MSGLRIVALLLSCLVSITAMADDPDTERGKRLYKVCAGCHGFAGEGNVTVGAPALSGQEEWYLSRQIENYQRGIRGGTDDDSLGVSMAVMAQALTSPQQVADVVAYIQTLSAAPVGAFQGDPAKGQQLYASCAACHGDRAQGNEALQAPALYAMPGWYQVAQLKKFKNGARGRHPEDSYGAQMAPMAATLGADTDMEDVTAYILSLHE